MKLLITIEQVKDEGFVASSDVIRCVASGRTISEAIDNFREALEALIEAYPEVLDLQEEA